MIDFLQLDDIRASKTTRFLNYLLDFIFVMIIIFIISTAYYIIDEESADAFFTEISNNSFMDRVLTAITFIIYYFITEYFLGRSLGKYITKTIIITEMGTKPTAYNIFIRSISRIIGLEALVYLFSESLWHDSWSSTMVVKKKDFERLESDNIDKIGIEINS